ncbi:hypothetical protein B0H14DRAFT_2686073, partial [Mycena olivaceomarginata]
RVAVHRIGGGTGGSGGAASRDGAAAADGASVKALVKAPLAPKFDGAVPPTVLEGGVGGPGGWGADAGGAGGGGGGPQVAIEYTRIAKEIIGGVGGSGGDSLNQGGQGGSGEAPNFATLLCSVGNATRNRTYQTDLDLAGFKAGHVSKLKAILVKVEAQAKATQAK